MIEVGPCMPRYTKPSARRQPSLLCPAKCSSRNLVAAMRSRPGQPQVHCRLLIVLLLAICCQHGAQARSWEPRRSIMPPSQHSSTGYGSYHHHARTSSRLLMQQATSAQESSSSHTVVEQGDPPVEAAGRRPEVISGGRIAPGWQSWSWSTQVPPEDAAATAAGALCTRIDAFGALSLKAPGAQSFPASSTRLHLDIFSVGGSDALNRLAIQLEGTSASTGAHMVSSSLSLAQLAKGNGGTMPSSADVSAADAFPGLASFDRVTIGRCLEQQKEGGGGAGGAGECTDMDAGPIVLCITKLSVDST